MGEWKDLLRETANTGHDIAAEELISFVDDLQRDGSAEIKALGSTTERAITGLLEGRLTKPEFHLLAEMIQARLESIKNVQEAEARKRTRKLLDRFNRLAIRSLLGLVAVL